MDLKTINTFIIAAEKSNFSKAAEILCYTQAAVTIQIKQLEKELGVSLFDRLGKNVFLTEKGQEFLKYARKIKMDVEEAKSLIRKESNYSGLLRVGMSESIFSICFPQILDKFHEMYPNIRLIAKTGLRDFIFDLMIHNELDLAYIIDHNLIDHDWIGKTVKKERVYFIASPQNPLVQMKSVSIENILSQELIMTECNAGYTYELSQLLAQNGLSMKPYLETGNTDIICSLVANNKGISYLPFYIFEREYKAGTIIPIRIPKYEVSVYRQLLWHKNKFLTKPMEYFLELMKVSNL